MVTDITERRRLEERLREASRMEAIGRLAGGISHEYNNLLTVINGFAQVMAETLPENDPGHTYLTEILKAGERAASLTRQLLSFSRKQMVQPRVLDLGVLVAGLQTSLASLLGENIRLEMQMAPEPSQARVDPGQIERALVYLADNARDAMPRGGRLTITTRNVVLTADEIPDRAEILPGPHVLLSVADTGHGMDEPTLARVFEPFFTTKGVGRGTGLGLAAVYGSVKQADGHIAVSSTVGVGTTFDIYLPSTPHAQGEGGIDSAGPRVPGSRETVLLVEDDAGVRSLTRHLLLAQGYTVLDAESGPAALELVARHPGSISLLVTDVVMPGMSGPQLARRLETLYPGSRVLYLSGYTEEEAVRHGIQEREAHFLSKPFTQEDFARTVRAALDSKG
jgi:nitrogen-specific signal transduction histidine kinase